MKRPRVAVVALVFGVVGAGCKKDKPVDVADAAPVAPIASGSGKSFELEQASTERAWVEARGGDPLELSRLADAVGVDRLAEVLQSPTSNDDDRATAIRAVAYVDDPTPALVPLAELVSPTSTHVADIVDTLLALAPKRAPIEEVQPDAWRTCAETLLVALKTTPLGARRAQVIRALIVLADRGAIDRALVPDD